MPGKNENKHTLEGPDFEAEVKAGTEDGVWQAKVRLQDDGIRGKNVVLNASSAELLAEELGRFESAFAQTRAKVEELAAAGPPVEPPAEG